MIFRAISCDYNPSLWDIQSDDGRVYRWATGLYDAVREARRMEAQANAA